VSVPLILRFPGALYAGRTLEEPVSTVDLVPTLCELLGLSLPPRSDGVSLVAAIEDRPFRRGTIFSQATQPYARVEPRGEWRNAYKAQCARNGPWKYVRAPYLQYEQLFHLDDDPLEQSDLLRAPDALTPQAKRALRELREELTAWSNSADPLPSSFNADQMEETRGRLEALGYGGQAPVEVSDESPK
jgi:arylsulfatase A-like enzyme